MEGFLGRSWCSLSDPLLFGHTKSHC